MIKVVLIATLALTAAGSPTAPAGAAGAAAAAPTAAPAAPTAAPAAPTAAAAAPTAAAAAPAAAPAATENPTVSDGTEEKDIADENKCRGWAQGKAKYCQTNDYVKKNCKKSCKALGAVADAAQAEGKTAADVKKAAEAIKAQAEAQP
mmetsp:Transcript_47320/g.93086  ORF Transcript_47320/g.93086 Transcript_47320/m.93086 type:complete len:148 (-) Transcript_47320:432-875(-)